MKRRPRADGSSDARLGFLFCYGTPGKLAEKWPERLDEKNIVFIVYPLTTEWKSRAPRPCLHAASRPKYCASAPIS